MDYIEQSTRTWLCSVVFLDIEGYSKKPVAQQMEMKELLNAFISRAIEHISETDRIILDTGDGAALCFMGDPEDALFVALSLRDVFGKQGQENETHLNVRIGVNLGPAKVVKDINGQLNIIGDSINVAQRVMSFSVPGQILVSRSFYEVISPLSQEYERLFHYRGLRKDKHVREHEVYEVMLTGPKRAKPEADSHYDIEALDHEDTMIVEHLVSDLGWDPEVLQTIRNQLVLHMGPLARLLVARAARYTSDLNELYQRLANHIPDKYEKEIFLKNAISVPPSPSDTPILAAQDEGKGWPPDTLQALESLLVHYIGPVAKIVVKREAKKAAHLQDLHRLLADHLSVAEERQAFLRDAARLG
jgi:class 3 adenylate cyclase